MFLPYGFGKRGCVGKNSRESNCRFFFVLFFLILLSTFYSYAVSLSLSLTCAYVFAGQKVAELEMYILLAQLVKHFNFNFFEEPLKYTFDWHYQPERNMNIVFSDLWKYNSKLATMFSLVIFTLLILLPLLTMPHKKVIISQTALLTAKGKVIKFC